MTDLSEKPAILVAGYLNHDRIWQLDRPLHPGRRHLYGESRIQHGGGGYFTASQLLDQGRRVELACWLGQDVHGIAARNELLQKGFSLRFANQDMAESVVLEVFLDPNGERTILAPGTSYPPLHLPDCSDIAAAYVNLRDGGPDLTRALGEIGLVMVQLPLVPTPHLLPADVAITSRSDFPGLTIGQIWQRAEKICTGRLRLLVVTRGAGAITLHHRNGREEEVLPRRIIEDINLIGAGDIFAGALLDSLLAGYDPASAALRACDQTGIALSRRRGG